MATLTEMLNNPKFKEMLLSAEKEHSPIDKAVMASMKEQMKHSIPIKDIRAALEKIDLGLGIQQLLEDPNTKTTFSHWLSGSSAEFDMRPAATTLNNLLVVGGIAELKELLTNIWLDDGTMRRLVAEGGDLAGITDPAAIIVAVAAWKTKQAAERSAYNCFTSRWSDNDDDDEYRFNTQGSGGAEYCLDLEGGKPLEGMCSFAPGEGSTTYPIHTIRENLCLDHSYEIDGKTYVTKILATSERPVDKRRLVKGLPRSWFGDIVGTDDEGRVVFGEALNADRIAEKNHGRAWNNWRLRWREGKKLSEPGQHDVPLYTINDLHRCITALLDAERPLENMMCEGEYDLPPRARSAYEGGVLDGNPRFFVSGKESKGDVVDVEFTVKDKATKAGGRTFPVTLADSVQGNTGKYTCHHCGKKGINKNKMKTYEPHGLPEGMPADAPGLEESQLWAMSCVCGDCRNNLLVSRSKAVAEWVDKQQLTEAVAKEKEKAEVSPEPKKNAVPEALLKQQEEYTEAWTKSEDNIATLEEEATRQMTAIKALKDSKVDVPAVLTAKLEELRTNIQAAKGVSASIEQQMNDVAAKITAIESVSAKLAAIENGAATPVRHNTQGNQAFGTKIPVTDPANKRGGMSRKQEKLAKKAAKLAAKK